MVSFDRSASFSEELSKHEIIITRALVRSGYRILVELQVIYLVDSKYYLCLNALSDSGDRC